MATFNQSICNNTPAGNSINPSTKCLAKPCSDFRCGPGVKAAFDAEAIAPFVIVGICGEEDKEGIQVGNKSAPNFGNRAVVSSLQYGQDTGIGATIEIIDEEGGAFHKFFDKILVSMREATAKYIISIQWGWVASKCDEAGIPRNQVRLAQSCVHTLILLRVSIKVESVIKFTLECTDTLQPAFETRHEKKHGTDRPQQKLKIKEAIRKACRENNPPIPIVEFRRRGDPSPDAWEFKDNPKCVWEGNQQSILGVLHRWIQPFVTDKCLGIKIAWRDTNGCKPTLVLWEDGSPRCNETIECRKDRSIGNYIVNGGPCSPVIEFNPQIKWNWAVAANTGGSVNRASSSNEKQKQDADKCDFDDEFNGQGSGTATNNATSTLADCVYFKEAATKLREHDKLHQRANRTYEPIRAELRIQGDPLLDDPIQLRFATAGIIVINPFHLSSKGITGCPEWFSSGVSGSAMANSTCNGILSNRCWIVNGVSHEIRLGAYTTTLNLFLPAPGSNINRDRPMGGCKGGHILRIEK